MGSSLENFDGLVDFAYIVVNSETYIYRGFGSTYDECVKHLSNTFVNEGWKIVRADRMPFGYVKLKKGNQFAVIEGRRESKYDVDFDRYPTWKSNVIIEENSIIIEKDVEL